MLLSDIPKYSKLTEKVKSMTLPVACFKCGARVGEVHRVWMCQHEKCPFCESQSLSCDCVARELNLHDEKKYTEATEYLPPDYYENGMSDGQYDEWMKICNIKGRKPFIEYTEKR
jgi:hypothetical protein